MVHTRSQDLEAHINTLKYNFIETQQEVGQLSANKNMHSSIAASTEELKQNITTHLESVSMMIYTKMHIPADPPLCYPPFHTEVETSSHSHNFQPRHL
jgi:hypothetical protein